MLDEALTYLARGWAVIPGHTLTDAGLCSCRKLDCDSPGKHPRIAWKEYQDHLPSRNDVEYWFGGRARWGTAANIIVLTGRVSGIVAVDIDPRHGGDESWREWCRTHPQAVTVTSLTGGGGTHLIYAHDGTEIGNSADILSGVDFRGDGGYILVPPSKHASGRDYAWDTEAHPDDMEPLPFPADIKLLVLQRRRGGGTEEERPRLNVDALLTGKQKIHEGERNSEMTRVVGYFTKASRSLDELVMMSNVVNVAACTPPLTEAELTKIARSIWGREREKTAAQRDVDDVLAEVEMLGDGEIAEPMRIADLLWGSCGVDVVTDWYQMQGERTEYVLVTPEDEIRFPDLLEFEHIRSLLLNHLGVLMPLEKKNSARMASWAQALRRVAREVVVEGRTAEERIADWVAAYVRKVGPRGDVPEGERRDALAMGPITIDGVLYLRPNKFTQFVEAQFGEGVRVLEMRRMLKMAGWEPEGRLDAYKRVLPGEQPELAEGA